MCKCNQFYMRNDKKIPNSSSSLTSSTTTSTSLPEASSFYAPLRVLSAHAVALASESTKNKIETPSALPSASRSTKKIQNGTHPILHTELPLALGHPPQLTRIPKHVVQRYLRRTCKLLVPHLTIQNGPPPSVQAPDHRRLELTRCNDFDRHDRFQDDRLRLRIDLTKSGNGGNTEGKFRRVHNVVRTILKDHTSAYNRVSRKRALLECFKPALRYVKRARQSRTSVSLHLVDASPEHDNTPFHMQECNCAGCSLP